MSDKCLMYMLMCQLLPLSHLAMLIKHLQSSQREPNTIYLPRNFVLTEHLLVCIVHFAGQNYLSGPASYLWLQTFCFFMCYAFQGSDSFTLRLFYNIQVKWWNNLMAGGGNTAPFITVTVMTALYKWEKLTNTLSDINEWTEKSVFLLKTHTLKCLGILQFGYPMLS